MRGHRTFRIDKLFGLATLVCILVTALMIYNDFFKGVEISSGTEKETQTETRTNSGSDKKENVSKSTKNITVCIDAAKGGKDAGLSANGKNEKNITLDMALAVKEKLNQQGINVVLTRTSDTDVTDEARVNTCNKASANIMISLRMNSYNNDTSVSGAESYIHTTKPTEAAELSRKILSSLETSAGIKNRGVKTGTVADAKENYYINAHSRCTSTIIDMGFITNASDLKKVTTDKDKTAQAIADGITDYLKQAGLY